MVRDRDIPWRAAIAGGTAQCVEAVLMHPLDLAKTRQQLYNTRGHHVPLTTVLKSAARSSQMFRGLVPAVGMQVPRGVYKFGIVSKVTSLVQRSDGQKTLGSTCFGGWVAGSTEALLITPFELVKVQVQGNVGETSPTLAAVKHIKNNEGIRGFWRGTVITGCRNGVWNAAYFGTLHALPQNLHTGSKPVWLSFCSGTLAGCLGTLFSTPLDVVKSRQQNISGARVSNVTIAAELLRQEGPSAFYKGLVAKLLRLGPGGGILFAVYSMVNKQLMLYDRGK